MPLEEREAQEEEGTEEGKEAGVGEGIMRRELPSRLPEVGIGIMGLKAFSPITAR